MIFWKVKKLLRKLGKDSVDKNWLLWNRANLIHFLKTGERKAPQERLEYTERQSALGIYLNLFTNKLKTMPAFLIALLILGSGAGITGASQTSLPTDVLYPVKIASERVAEILIPGDNYKAGLGIKLADRRLEEIEKLIEKYPQEQGLTQKTVERLEKQLNKIGEKIEEKKLDEKSVAKIDASLNKYEKTLDMKAEKFAVDNPLKESLKKAQEKVLEKAIKIQEITPPLEMGIKPERAGEKLGSEKKDIWDIKILGPKELKEASLKRIERAKEKIRGLEILLQEQIEGKELEEIIRQYYGEKIKELEKLDDQALNLLQEAEKDFEKKEFSSAMLKATQSLRILVEIEIKLNDIVREIKKELTIEKERIHLLGEIESVNLGRKTIILKTYSSAENKLPGKIGPAGFGPNYEILITSETKVVLGLGGKKIMPETLEQKMEALKSYQGSVGVIARAKIKKFSLPETSASVIYENIVAEEISGPILFK